MPLLQEDKSFDSKMTDDAFELLRCFYDGLDELVEGIAFNIAKNQGSFSTKEGQSTVTIEQEHVREAGKKVFEKLMDLVSEEKLPQEILSHFENMMKCSDSNPRLKGS